MKIEFSPCAFCDHQTAQIVATPDPDSTFPAAGIEYSCKGVPITPKPPGKKCSDRVERPYDSEGNRLVPVVDTRSPQPQKP